MSTSEPLLFKDPATGEEYTILFAPPPTEPQKIWTMEVPGAISR
jgi:hypothetical protein